MIPFVVTVTGWDCPVVVAAESWEEPEAVARMAAKDSGSALPSVVRGEEAKVRAIDADDALRGTELATCDVYPNGRAVEGTDAIVTLGDLLDANEEDAEVLECATRVALSGGSTTVGGGACQAVRIVRVVR